VAAAAVAAVTAAAVAAVTEPWLRVFVPGPQPGPAPSLVPARVAAAPAPAVAAPSRRLPLQLQRGSAPSLVPASESLPRLRQLSLRLPGGLRRSFSCFPLFSCFFGLGMKVC